MPDNGTVVLVLAALVMGQAIAIVWYIAQYERVRRALEDTRYQARLQRHIERTLLRREIITALAEANREVYLKGNAARSTTDVLADRLDAKLNGGR